MQSPVDVTTPPTTPIPVQPIPVQAIPAQPTTPIPAQQAPEPLPETESVLGDMPNERPGTAGAV